MKSKNTPERYPLHQSPLYCLKGKGQFEKVLGVEWAAVSKLLASDNYRVWENDKGREIQQPIGWLAHVHGRISKLLSRIELPDYLYSQKGRSYADNAREHVGSTPLIKTDIHKFYPSTTRQMVYRMFVMDFMCAEDIAHCLADICCYRQKHLPTGSALSGRVAFFAARHMFDDIAELAARERCLMTAYVDDVTVSGAAATKRLLGEVRRVVSRHGYKTKQRKSKTYAAASAKVVTGAIVAGDELRLPNERHRKIWQAKQELSHCEREEKTRLMRTLRGRLQEARQILDSRRTEPSD
ncbi:reverse transcriptase family protein [Burkholderia pseudomallei MSHR2451]|uniref:reverse transcriptase family protein n=1 Tax=Burkholderia pseudomallei TaxID=28450 RepID=UPI0005387B29|nr:reverse transcriptase family protein [Burkholderia pseudomallei]KGW20495.1 reverse transcriptase family protein [Burkholderia pseudomallei MSHR2451]